MNFLLGYGKTNFHSPDHWSEKIGKILVYWIQGFKPKQDGFPDKVELGGMIMGFLFYFDYWVIIYLIGHHLAGQNVVDFWEIDHWHYFVRPYFCPVK